MTDGNMQVLRCQRRQTLDMSCPFAFGSMYRYVNLCIRKVVDRPTKESFLQLFSTPAPNATAPPIHAINDVLAGACYDKEERNLVPQLNAALLSWCATIQPRYPVPALDFYMCLVP